MWTESEHIRKVKPFADNMINSLKSNGVEFFDTDDSGFENVVFKHKDKTIKISKHSFYRFSGIAVITKEGKEKNSSECIKVTDEMYMNSYMKPIVLKLLGIS